MRSLPALLLACLSLAACTDPLDVEPVGDYTTWKRKDVTGPAPGHGDGYRIIFANPVAANPASSIEGGWPAGTIIVKEIRDEDGGGPGGLRYVALMRRDPAETATGGWLFSKADEPGGEEERGKTCWSCHQDAPFAGAWFDYRM